MLEELYSVLKSQTKVYQMDDHLELPQFGFQIYRWESLDYPGTYRFFVIEDWYQVAVCDSIADVFSTLRDFR